MEFTGYRGVMNDPVELLDEDDDTPQLSAHTLAALQEFYAEQASIEQQLLETKAHGEDCHSTNISLLPELPEDWVCNLKQLGLVHLPN
jgi:hypothetical protein